MKPKKVFLAAAACALCAALCACSLKFWEKPEPYGTHQDTSGQQPPVYEDVTPSSAPSSGSEARVQHTLEGTGTGRRHERRHHPAGFRRRYFLCTG